MVPGGRYAAVTASSLLSANQCQQVASPVMMSLPLKKNGRCLRTLERGMDSCTYSICSPHQLRCPVKRETFQAVEPMYRDSDSRSSAERSCLMHLALFRVLQDWKKCQMFSSPNAQGNVAAFGKGSISSSAKRCSFIAIGAPLLAADYYSLPQATPDRCPSRMIIQGLS